MKLSVPPRQSRTLGFLCDDTDSSPTQVLLTILDEIETNPNLRNTIRGLINDRTHPERRKTR